MISDGFTRFIAKDIMNWFINNLGNPMRSSTKSDLILSLLPTKEILVTKKGLVFRKMRYSNERYLRENLFAKAREKTFKVKISFDNNMLQKSLGCIGF